MSTDPTSSPQSPARPAPHRAIAWRTSPVVKVVTIGVLTLLMLIPIEIIASIIAERQWRSEAAIQEIGQSWSGAQVAIGPVLAIPFREIQVLATQPVRRTRTNERIAYVLAEDLDIDVTLKPEVRRRGLFEATVYTMDLSLEGTMAVPGQEFFSENEVEVQWDRADLLFFLTDQRSAPEGAAITVGTRSIPFEAGTPPPGLTPATGSPWGFGAFRAPLEGIGLSFGSHMDIAMALTLRGSSRFALIPTGRQTGLDMSSTWPDPSFFGPFLPATADIGPEGFKATWSISHLGRAFPQAWIEAPADGHLPFSAMPEYAFGVHLLQAVDTYHLVERSAKYGILFVVFTFAALFLFEVVGGRRVHLVQYGMVGLSLSIFYLLLLSLSEQVPFAVAYAVGAALVVGEIGLYGMAVMRGARPAALLAGLLAGLYAALYVLLRLEDLALLLGSVGLFLGLGAAMYVTRRIDWYGANPPVSSPA